MNVCKVPDVCKNMEYKLVTEDSKTRVYLSLVREFNKAEYEKYYRAKKKAKMKKTNYSCCKSHEICSSRSGEYSAL